MIRLNRRCFLAASVSQLAVYRSRAEAQAAGPAEIGLGFGTYGMQGLATAKAAEVCAEIGYDGIELALMSGWPTEPKLLTQQDRAELRRRLTDLRLAVPSLLESLHCLRGNQVHRDNIEKLKLAAQLAHELSPDKPPIVQSVVGGKSDQWDQVKEQLAEQLADWASVGQENRTVICFKPHAAHVVDSVQRALWLHQQVGSQWLKIVYDYSHLFLKGYSLAGSLEQLLPISAYVQVKDSRRASGRNEYLLPGDGDTDYAELLTILKRAQYHGFVNVEVSSMIHRKPEYEPVAAARLCYQRLAPLFEQVGVLRPPRR